MPVQACTHFTTDKIKRLTPVAIADNAGDKHYKRRKEKKPVDDKEKEKLAEMDKELEEGFKASIEHCEKMMEGRPPKPPRTGVARVKWWDMVLEEVESGRNPRDVAAEYGITYNELRRTQGVRKTAKFRADVKQGSTPDPQATPTQSVATPANEASRVNALIRLPDKNSAHVDEALVRSTSVLGSIDQKDSTKLKAAALIMVGEIIHQASDRLDSEGAD